MHAVPWSIQLDTPSAAMRASIAPRCSSIIGMSSTTTRMTRKFIWPRKRYIFELPNFMSQYVS